MRILTVIGTRPEALKMGPVLQTLAATPGVESHLCLTGQHRDLVHSPLAVFGLHGDTDLQLMRPNQRPDDFLGRLLPRLGRVLRQVRPDWVLAAGDTTSVLGASLAAAHHRVLFGHVEAGLRTACRTEPFPEEANRRLVTVLADLHFAPTSSARANLLRENISASAIRVTGNTIIDAIRIISRQPLSAHPTWLKLLRQLDLPLEPTAPTPQLAVVTFHRRENFGQPAVEICHALRELASAYAGRLKLLCVVHPHPAMRQVVRSSLRASPHVVLSDPLDYPVMLALMRRATVVLTDSGGLQEEAPSLGVPVLVLRRQTERPEGIAAGTARLVAPSAAAIIAATRQLLDQPAVRRAMTRGFTGYGDGQAASRILAALLAHPLQPGLPDYSDAA